MNTASCLAHLRKLAKKAESAAELVPWLTVPVLEAAEFTIFANYPTCICAERERDGLEIRVSLANGTIGGSKSDRPRMKGPPGFIDNAAEALKALWYDGHQQPPQVRVTTTRELDWRDVVSLI